MPEMPCVSGFFVLIRMVFLVLCRFGSFASGRTVCCFKGPACYSFSCSFHWLLFSCCSGFFWLFSNFKRVKRAAKVVSALTCMRITAPRRPSGLIALRLLAPTDSLLSFFPFFLLKNLRCATTGKEKVKQVFTKNFMSWKSQDEL